MHLLNVFYILPLLQQPLHPLPRLVSWSATASLGSYQGGAGELNLATLGWNHVMAQVSHHTCSQSTLTLNPV